MNMLQYAMFNPVTLPDRDMTALNNDRHEAFALALAQGLSRKAAYVEAGYSGKDIKRADRLAGRAEVQARAEELSVAIAWGGDPLLKGVFDRLLSHVPDPEKLEKLADMVAAKALLAEAARIRQKLPPLPPAALARALPPRRPTVSMAEWLKRYGAPSGSPDDPA